MTLFKCPLNSLLENANKLYQSWQFRQDMTKYLKTTEISNQQFQDYFNKMSLWMMEGPHGSWCFTIYKRDECKVTGVNFADVKMKLIFDYFGGSQTCLGWQYKLTWKKAYIVWWMDIITSQLALIISLILLDVRWLIG